MPALRPLILLLTLAAPIAARADVIINEVLYHPDPDNTGGEFVELFNNGDMVADLTGWSFVGAITFEFSTGTVLEAGTYLVVAREPEEARRFYMNGAIVGPYDGRLDNAGEQIVLQDNDQQEIDSVTYHDESPWPADADGGGPSLELVDASSDNSLPDNWALGAPFTPGLANAPAASDERGIVITEIMYKPLRQESRQKFDHVNSGLYTETGEDEFGEYVELMNRSDRVVDLSGWEFTEGIEFTFPDGSQLEPGGYLIVAATPEMLKARHAITAVLGPFSLSLRNGGERITLRDAGSVLVDTVRYNDKYPWPTAPDEFGAGLEVIAPSEDNGAAKNWRTSRDDFPRAPLILDDEPTLIDGWQRVSLPVDARDRTLIVAFWVDAAGEWLIDDVEFGAVSGEGRLEESVIKNGSFDQNHSGWTTIGNHSTSFWTAEDGRESPGAVHLVATGGGSSSNSFRIRLRNIQIDKQYRFTAWAKYVRGSAILQARALGSDLRQSIYPSRSRLSESWSDRENPNGLWSYRDDAGEPLTQMSENWLETDLGGGQPAWIRGDAETPGWCRSVGNAPNLDFPAGRVAAHGRAEVWWISPAFGQVTISGGVFPLRPSGRDQPWEIRRNDRTLTSGIVPAGQDDVHSGSPVSLDSGSGGPKALTTTVEEGDTIRAVVGAPDAADADFVGLDLRVVFRSGHEPETPLSGFIGFGSPGRLNSVFSSGLPPFVDDLEHFPEQPASTDVVTVTAKVSSAVDLSSVELALEILEGTQRTLVDPLPMFDDGTHNDGAADDGVYGVQVPARSSQTLVHYWVRAEDSDGKVTTFPYDDEPSPVQAYFHYDNEIDTKMTTFHMFMSEENLDFLTRNPRTPEYQDCSVVIDDRRMGKEAGPITYPHIGARHRGRRSRMNSQHQWKFKFNRVKLYDHNRTLDTMLAAAMVQRLGFFVFDVAGIENLESDIVRLQLNGSFWAYYVVFESPNSTWAEKHGYGNATEAYKARSIENPPKSSDLFRHRILTDWDFWGVWNKKMRSLERPVHIRELVDALNDTRDQELIHWMSDNVDVTQILTRHAINVLLNIDDFLGHNYYMLLPEDDKWKMLGYDYDSLGRLIVGNLPLIHGDDLNRFFAHVGTNRTLSRLRVLNYRKILNTFFTEEVLFPLIDAEVERADPRARSGAASHAKQQIRTQRRLIGAQIQRLRLPGEEFVPEIAPPGGTFTEPVSVTLSVPERWLAVYTVDGSDPRLSPTAENYSRPIPVDKTTTIRAAGTNGTPGSGKWGDLSEALYEIELPDVPLFVRGDFNIDGRITTTDVVRLLFHLFRGRDSTCRIAGDANNDDTVNIADAIFVVNYLFRHGPEPAQPFPEPGLDPDGLEPLGCVQGLRGD